MGLLDKIGSRIRKDPEWKKKAQAAYKQSRVTATRIPLLHVIGSPRFPFLRLCTYYAGKIPISDDTDYASPSTRHKEDEFGFGRSLYFYAGRAHKDYGEVALGFAPSVEEGHTGSVTTTGYYASQGYTHLPCNDPALRKGYIATSTYPLDPDETVSVPPWPTPLRPKIPKDSGLTTSSTPSPKPKFYKKIPRWRVFFAIILAAYFPDNRHYWEGCPFRDDPDGIFRQVHDWRAWAWEVRFSESESLKNVEAWCPRCEVWNEIQQVVFRAGFPGAEAVPDALIDLLDSSELIERRGSPEYAKKVERWAQEQCGL